MSAFKGEAVISLDQYLVSDWPQSRPGGGDDARGRQGAKL